MMNRDKFIAIQSRRGYKVETLGNIVILRHVKNGMEYTAMWFYNADGTYNDKYKPTWIVRRI